MKHNLADVQGSLYYEFRRPELLSVALTHSSYANESEEEMEHNERLEFLGDAVLELCVSEELFKLFPDVREGELTKMRARLVGRKALCELSLELGLDKHVVLGRGEESQGGRSNSSLLSDVFEAVLGAVFLDRGYAGAKEWLKRVFEGRWPKEPVREGTKDYKSRLQELTQKVYKERPVYALCGSEGPEHQKMFDVKLTLPTGESLIGKGTSVKKAEQAAASEALKRLQNRDE